MTTPNLNQTSHPVIQQQTEGSLLSERTVILSTSNESDSIPKSKLTDKTVQFLNRTDFKSSYVVGFEVEVTEWGHYLRLEAVDRQSNQVHIKYSDVLVEGGPNVEQHRAMFVRLPRRDGVPETVELERTDDEQ